MNIKHVGKMKVTGRRLIVITPRIPGKEDCALIVDTDSLRDSYLNTLMDAVTTPEAQQSNDLGMVLSRISSPEQGVSFLTSLHRNNFLTSAPIKDIIMLPSPSTPLPLEYAIRLMEGESVDTITRIMEGEEIKKYEDDTLHGFANQQKSLEIANKESIAYNILAEAERLAFDANRKREEAYKIAPHLRPVVQEAPPAAKTLGEDLAAEKSIEIPSIESIMEEAPKPKRTRSRKKTS